MCLFLHIVIAQCATYSADLEKEALYTRIDILSAMVGQVEYRKAYTKRLDLPVVECEAGLFACSEDRIYGQVYSLVFTKEALPHLGTGNSRSDGDSAGSLLLAVEVSAENESWFEGALRAHLNGLSAISYLKPQAGMGVHNVEPITQRFLMGSALPVWLCTEKDNLYSYDQMTTNLDDNGGRSFSSRSGAGEIAERACIEIRRSVEDVFPDVYRTMPDIHSQLRTSVRLESASTVTGLQWSDDVAPIPEEAEFKKAKRDERKTGSIRDRQEGVFRGHEGIHGRVERDVLLPPAAMNIVAKPMWATEWTFEAKREEFGNNPTVGKSSFESIVMAVLPVIDPVMGDFARARTPMMIPEDRIIEAVLQKFELSAALDPDLVLTVLNDPKIWPDEGEWMVVACFDNGTARYGIAPFVGVAEVTNPRETCAVIRTDLGD